MMSTEKNETPRPLTAEDLYDLQLITDAQISPDGQAVIYSQQKVDRESEKKYTNLWLVHTADGTPRQFTYGNQADVSPRWSPDGQTIAFLSNRGDEKQMQIYLIGLHGGEARPLTTLEGSLGRFEWSPDGSKMVLTLTKKDADAKEREADERKKKLGVVDRHITEVVYKFDGIGYLPKEKRHIWVVDTESGEAIQLTDGEFDEANPTWSPNGEQILFISNREPDWEFNGDGNEMYLMPSAGGELTKVVAHDGGKHVAVFSPDGRFIAYRGSQSEKRALVSE